MSFKLFFLSTFGGIKSTEKVEAAHQKLWEDYQEYLKVKDSEDLKSYLELEKFVKSDAFSQAKKKMLREKFKGSQEEKQQKEFKKLEKNKSVRKYLQNKGDEVLAGSPTVKRYEQLKAAIDSEEFKVRKAYLQDSKRWEKTDEFQKEQLYNELKQRPQFVKYFKYKDSNAFEFFENWGIVFEDQFKNKLDTEKWSTISKMAKSTVGRNFSKAGDLQAFTSNGENISVSGGKLQIEAKKEKAASLVWSPAGFQEIDMDYSSGLLTTDDLFAAKYGIIEAKINYQPEKSLMDVFYLSGSSQTVRLNLLEMGKVNRIGLSRNKDGEWKNEGISLNGLSTGKPYIFRMEWEPGKLTWKINNKEVFSTQSHVPSEEMALQLATLVIDATNGLSHRFTVDWIRFFQKK